MDINTPANFLETLFPPHMTPIDEAPVVAWPASFRNKETGRVVDYYAQRQWHPRRVLPHDCATYYCLSTVRKQGEARQVRKTLDDVRTARVLVIDDVGTKSKPPCVTPTYKLETSEGNFQWGYALTGFDVSTPDGQHYFDSVLYSLALAGHNDPGFRSATRLARLPGSLHRSGFEARIIEWNRSARFHLADLFPRFNIPLEQPRKARSLTPGKHTQLATVTDSVYDWLLEVHPLYGHSDQWLFIECPWRHRHTDKAQGASSTAYSPLDYGQGGRGFKCLHGHCADKHVGDFLQWCCDSGARYEPGARYERGTLAAPGARYDRGTPGLPVAPFIPGEF